MPNHVRLLSLMPDTPIYEPTEADVLCDRVMVAGTGVLKALERKVSTEEGLQHVRELAAIASRAEALLIQWQRESRKAR